MNSINALRARIEGQSPHILGKTYPGFSISKINQKTILEYDELLESQGKKPQTRYRYVHIVAYLCHITHKPLEVMTQQDIVRFINKFIQNGKFCKRTRNLYKSALRHFFKVRFGGGKKLPEVVEFIEFERMHRSDKETVRPEDILSRDDLNKLIEACHSPQRRAIVVTLFESLFRRTELTACGVKDLKFHPGYAILTCPRGKTGSYSATLTESVPYLKTHLNHHPNKTNQDAPLFYSEQPRSYGKPLTDSGLYFIVKDVARVAGLKKRIWVHLFRHSRSTELHERYGFSIPEINLMSGRNQDSTCGNIYLALSKDKIRNKLLQKTGVIKKQNGHVMPELPKITCWSCGTENPAANQVCLNDDCNLPLRPKDTQKARLSRVADAMMIIDRVERLQEHPKAYKEFVTGIKKVDAILKSELK